MVRHFSSFIFSSIVHIFLLALLFLTYEIWRYSVKEVEKTRVALKLLNVVDRQDIHMPKKEVVREETHMPKKIKQEPKISKQTTSKIEAKKEASLIQSEEQETKAAEIVKTQEHSQNEMNATIVQKQPPRVEEQEFSHAKKQPDEIYYEENLQKISQLLEENLYYPRSARKRREEGVVIVEFILQTDATVKDTKVIESQSDILSRAAMKTIEDLSGIFPKPKESLRLRVPITYKLN